MVTPSTWFAAILLLVLSFFCLGAWINVFKQTGRWRFELFSFDFAIGALLLAVLAAYTFGTLGSQLGFSDQMLVAGRTNQALAVLGGGAFALGNMLLLSAVSLIGISASFPIAFGLALTVSTAYYFKPAHFLAQSIAMIFVVVAAVLAGLAARTRGAALQMAAPQVQPSPPKPAGRSRSRSRHRPPKVRPLYVKGIFVAVLGGIGIGASLPIIDRGETGDLGLGPYAGALLFTLGMLGSTVVLNIYFMNIAIHGGRITPRAYWKGQPKQHLLGFLGGGVWAAGALALGLALSLQGQNSPSPAVELLLPLASVPLAVIFGVFGWKEFGGAPSATLKSLLASVAFFLGGAALLAFSVRR